MLQWRNRLAHGTYRQYKELCRGCEFEPHLEQHVFERGYLLTYRNTIYRATALVLIGRMPNFIVFKRYKIFRIYLIFTVDLYNPKFFSLVQLAPLAQW